MKGVFVVYLVLALYMTTAAGEGFHGMEVSGDFNATELEEGMTNITIHYDNTNSTILGFLDPVRGTIGFIKGFFEIVLRSLTFQVTITGAPDVVNEVIRVVFFALGWIAFYDLAVIIGPMIATVAGKIL